MRLSKEVGPKKTREPAVKAGIPSDTSRFDNGLGNVLGSADAPHRHGQRLTPPSPARGPASTTSSRSSPDLLNSYARRSTED